MMNDDEATVLIGMSRVCPREGCNADIYIPAYIDFRAGDFTGMLDVSFGHLDLTELDKHYEECHGAD